ncbi:MAG: hypothetical protein ACLFRD_04600 [Nitriliruptoraceae bacterium]
MSSASGPDRTDAARPAAAQPAEQAPPRPRSGSRSSALRLLARRQRLGILVTVAVIALLLGVLIGRGTASGPEADARQAVEATVLQIALDADGIWTSTTDDRPPVSEGLVRLRGDGDPRLVERHLDEWLAAYDQAMIRLAGEDLPASARPVQRQLIAGVMLSRDAVEVLGHAASIEDETARIDLTTEVGRLRMRSEQLIQSARASTADLDGSRTDVSPPQELRDFQEGRRD